MAKISIEILKETGVGDLFKEVKQAMSLIDPSNIINPDYFGFPDENGHTRSIELNRADAETYWIANAKDGFFLPMVWRYDADRLERILSETECVIAVKERVENAIQMNNAAEPSDVREARAFQLNNYLKALTNVMHFREFAELAVKTERSCRAGQGFDQKAFEILQRIYPDPDISEIVIANEEAKWFEHRMPPCDDIPIVSSMEMMKLFNFKIQAEEIKGWFEWTMKRFQEFGFEPVECVIDPTATALGYYDRGDNGKPRLVVPPTRELSALEMLSMTAHEVLTHWLDYRVADSYFLVKENDDKMEEGHALYNQDLVRRKYAGERNVPLPYYLIAVDRAKRGWGFSKIAEEIYHKTPDRWTPDVRYKRAFTTAYRVLRGSFDQTPGCYMTKDCSYFSGFHFVNRLKDKRFLDFSILSTQSMVEMIDLFDTPDRQLPRVKVIHDMMRSLVL